jgi:hypothetical protein
MKKSFMLASLIGLGLGAMNNTATAIGRAFSAADAPSAPVFTHRNSRHREPSTRKSKPAGSKLARMASEGRVGVRNHTGQFGENIRLAAASRRVRG